ncbi:MAG: glycosyltransferase family 2 protein [Candidatus Methylomirabilis oxyfera]|nr:glycosyltransferase family 2 protein [Candidatus Methylomirabilis oxyfera]
MRPAAGTRVSIILLNYNSMRFIDPLLESLSRQTYGPFEILLFDNGSVDGSIAYVKRCRPEISVYEMGRNTGFSLPINEGIRRARGDYLLILNMDVVIEHTFIEAMVNAIETDARVGWVAGKMLKLTAQGKSAEIDCLGHHMARDRYAKETDYSVPFRWEDYAAIRPVFGASACAALYRRAMLDDVAPDGEFFDEDFFAYFEDVDLDWRAQQRGWVCLYTPGAVGYHVRGGSGLSRQPEIAACQLSNRILTMLKNDDLGHILQDIRPITRRTLRDVAVCWLDNPRVLWRALVRVVRLLPRMMQKRRTIRKRRLVSPAYLRSMIR